MDTSVAQTVSESEDTEDPEHVAESPTKEPVTSATGDSSTGLLLLAPGYDEAQHGAYVRHLKNALEGEDSGRIRNIALTGGYGSGKSSILEALDGGEPARKASWKLWEKQSPQNRIISLALSTLGDEPSNEETPPVSKTNRIQKELVKQLLYREEKVPGSRYRRIGSFQWRRELGAALMGSAVLVVLGYITRFTDRWINFAGTLPAGRLGMHLALFVFVALVFFGVRRVFHNRLWVDKFVAGPATISLSNTAGSYFDEYLDEIVHFFQATKYDVVIFEDIDRFEDPHIFQTLRELNTILNNSTQLDRNIRFIYAIKDSIFEQLGTEGAGSSKNEGTAQTFDAAKAETERANRTKFFDIVIPVVPFITHRSSRDHLTDMLEKSGFEISRDLTNLVARHIVDMRLLKNIHNEFAVFREQLLLPTDRLEGLNADSLFAMVVYKNIHLSDFERIKAGTSQLDELYAASRALVEENVANLDEEAEDIRAKRSRQASAESMAESLGEALERYFERTFRHQNQNMSEPYDMVTSVSWKSGALPISTVRTPDFWRKYTETRETLAVTARGRHNAFFTFEDVSEALGEDLSPGQWEKHNRFKLDMRFKTIEHTRNVLMSADMAKLIQHPELKLDRRSKEWAFNEICNELLESRLAVDLVAHGYIDRNFALYTSHFQGVHISLQAMNFIIHHVHPNTLGIYYELSKPEDIEAVLSDAAANLGERSMYSLSILDYLLEKGDSRCDPIVRNLAAASGQDERKFLQVYLRGGKHPAALCQRMAPNAPDIFQRIFKLHATTAVKATLINAALSGTEKYIDYNLDGLQPFIEENYTSMNVFTTEDESAEPTNALVKIMVSLGISFPTITTLNKNFKQLAVEHSLYDVTRTNLRVALDGQTNLALNAIKDSDVTVYNHVLNNATKYAQLIANTNPPAYTISSADRFVEILEEALAVDGTSAKALIPGASPDCRIISLENVSSGLWPTLATQARFIPSFANLKNYCDTVGVVDEALATLLNASDKIQDYEEETEDDKEALAVTILNAKETLLEPEAKSRLVRGLELEDYISIAQVQVAEGQLLGVLIRDQIVVDAVTSFDSAVGLAWDTREFAIRQSKNFPKYMSPAHLPSRDLGPLMTSDTVPEHVKTAVIRRLPEFAPGAGRSALTEVASYAHSNHIELDEASLRVLAAGKADPITFIDVLEPALTTLGTAVVTEFLELMGAPYRKLTEFGGPVRLPRTTSHRVLASYVEKFGRASSDNWDKTQGKRDFQVFMKRRPAKV
ncbi:hypothetical protein [Arthrobacter sp. 18067]|uniref:YobI family P-loop NTPase n=1 Tax=Arthrobacter sp. 18067 TaxID=2681413 RepID=UPI00135BFDD6|nr:hypothetical protein [Arthrobacter sp. 18067]